MPALKTTLCPKCGAPVDLSFGQASAICPYCGTKSYAASPHGPSPVAAPSQGGRVMVVMFIALGAALLMGLVSVVLFTSSAPTTMPMVSSSAPIVVAPLVPSMPPPRPAEVPVVQVSSDIVPMASDVDGDHRDELVVGLRSSVGSTTTEHFAVFDPQTGAERVRTPALEGLSQLLSAARGNRLVVAGAHGELTGYDLVSGARQWTTTLGDRVTTLCAAPALDAIHVETADARRLLVDLTTGRQTETRDTCRVVLARGDAFDDPRDRRDYSAPAGVDAYHCGGAHVMGSQNYTVPDACLARAHVDTDRLDGMIGHRLWRVDGGWLAFGVRSPGAYVPMVGRLARGSAFVWKNEVPVSDPLRAETGGPRHAVLAGGALVVAYSMENPRQSYVTAFALADGARRFTTPVPGDAGIGELVAVGDTLAVQTGELVVLLSAADGTARATIGTAR